MEKLQSVKLGFYVPYDILDNASSSEDIIQYMTDGENMYGRILLTLADYLQKYSKVFEEPEIKITAEDSAILPNGTLKGFKRFINTGEIDIAVEPTIIYETNMKIADFSYPFQMFSATFVIRKPEYEPEVLGILKTFSWQLWIAIFSILIAMSIIYYVGFKKKYPLDKFILHTFAVLLRHN